MFVILVTPVVGSGNITGKYLWAQILPASSQEEEAQSHVMSHVETVVHLTTSSLV